VVEVAGPAMEEECLDMLKTFFRDLRARKKENPGDSEDSAAIAPEADTE
jgi:hypothetical protein